jgi:hypothetical protein
VKTGSFTGILGDRMNRIYRMEVEFMVLSFFRGKAGWLLGAVGLSAVSCSSNIET